MQPTTWDAPDRPLPKIYKLRITLPTALWRLPKLLERLQLEPGAPLNYWSPQKSSWEWTSRYAPLAANIIQNNIWAYRARDVKYCEEFERFAEIVRFALDMPAVEAEMAEFINEEQIAGP